MAALGMSLTVDRSPVAAFGAWVPNALAAWVANRLFTMTWRPRMRPEQRKVLARAWQFPVRMAGGNAVTTYVWGDDDAPTVLLMHGWNGYAGQWAAFVDPFLRRGYRVVALDAPAHGASPGRFTTAGHMARALRAVAEAVGGVDVAVAHSLGSVALGLACRWGLRLKRVALVAPVPTPRPYAEVLTQVLGMSQRGRARALAALPQLAGVRGWSDLSLADAASAMPAPWVVHDEGDRTVPLSAMREVLDGWPGAALTVTTGLGHRRILADAAVVSDVVSYTTPIAPS